MSEKKLLKNRNEIVTKCVIPAVLIGSGVLSILGLAGFVHNSKQYNNCQQQIDNKLQEITTSEEFANYKIEEVNNLYKFYKDGSISAKEFENLVNRITTYEYLMSHDIPCITPEEKDELKDLEDEKMKESLETLASVVGFVGCGTIAFAGSTAYLNTNDEEREMA